jgi:hypothetical protein
MPRKRSLAVLGGVLALAGCGTATRTITHTVTVTVTRTITRAPATVATPRAPSASGVGQLTVHDFSGNTLAVKANGYVDPATPQYAGFGPAAGSRLIAVKVTLAGQGPGTISSDANANMTLIGTDGQAYTADFGAVTECTNFSHGNYTLFRGDSERGCVVFKVPDGVRVNSVQFALNNNTVQFNTR